MNLLGKRLVIFGCGYIGTEVARQALARGLRVTALTRNPATAASLCAVGIEAIEHDLASDGWHQKIRGPVDFVLNSVSSGGGGLDGYRSSYVLGMRSILQWAHAAHLIGTLVYTSSTSVYPQDGGVQVDELASTDLAGAGGQLLREAEALLETHACPEGNGIGRYFILRLAGIYGPGRRHLLDQVRCGVVAGKTDIHLNVIHRDDVCSAIWSAFTAPATVASSIYNVADDSAATRGQIVGWLARELNVTTPTFTGVPAGTRRALTPDRIILNSKIKSALGWQPSFADFRSGYKNMLAVGTD